MQKKDLRGKKLSSFIESFKGLLEEEYQRGRTEAAYQMAEFVKEKRIFPQRVKTLSRKANRVSKKATKKSRVRAPRGTARFLAERVLKSGPHTISEICNAAQSPTEKLATYQTVRLELEKGKKEKKYVKVGNLWSLTS